MAAAELFRSARLQRGLTPQQCARQAGYTNVDKGANRLLAIEGGRDRFPDKDVWTRFADVLGLDREEVDRLIAEEHRRVQSIHVKPYVVMKPFAGFYYRHETPPGLSDEELVAFAQELADERGHQTCVVFGPARCTYIEPSGRTWSSDRPPFMRLS